MSNCVWTLIVIKVSGYLSDIVTVKPEISCFYSYTIVLYLEYLGHTGWYFPKQFLNSKISCVSTSLKK